MNEKEWQKWADAAAKNGFARRDRANAEAYVGLLPELQARADELGWALEVGPRQLVLRTY